MQNLIYLALSGMLLAQGVQAETTTFTSDTVVINYNAEDLTPMQAARGSTATFYANYIDYPLNDWAKGRTASYIQAIQDATQFVTPPMALPPGATIAYEVDYALWFPLNGNTINTFFNRSAPFFFTANFEKLSSCTTPTATAVEPPAQFRRVYASTIFATENPTAMLPIDLVVGQQQSILDKFKPGNPVEYATNSAMGVKDIARSNPWQNTSTGFVCSRIRIVFPKRLEVAVYSVKVTIRN